MKKVFLFFLVVASIGYTLFKRLFKRISSNGSSNGKSKPFEAFETVFFLAV